MAPYALICPFDQRRRNWQETVKVLNGLVRYEWMNMKDIVVVESFSPPEPRGESMGLMSTDPYSNQTLRPNPFFFIGNRYISLITGRNRYKPPGFFKSFGDEWLWSGATLPGRNRWVSRVWQLGELNNMVGVIGRGHPWRHDCTAPRTSLAHNVVKFCFATGNISTALVPYVPSYLRPPDLPRSTFKFIQF